MTPRVPRDVVRRLVEQGRIVDPGTTKRTTRKTAAGPYHTICVSTTCHLLTPDVPSHDCADGALSDAVPFSQHHLNRAGVVLPADGRNLLVRELGVDVRRPPAITEPDTRLAQRPEDGGAVASVELGKLQRAHARLVETLSFGEVERPVLVGVDSPVSLWGHYFEVLRAVVTLVAVDVVDVFVVVGTGHQAVLIGLDSLRWSAPDENHVAALESVAARCSRWDGLARAEPPLWAAPPSKLRSPALIASASLAGRSWYCNRALDTDDFAHGVIVQVGCNTEFTTRASEDRHVDETHHARYALVLP
jgi:hypothetical protein